MNSGSIHTSHWVVYDELDIFKYYDDSNPNPYDVSILDQSIKILFYYLNNNNIEEIICYLEIINGVKYVKSYYNNQTYFDLTNYDISSFSQDLVINPTYSTFNNSNNYMSANDISNAFYYEKLKENMPSNIGGTCTYVAATMLFSYYDILCNDNAVQDNNLYLTPSTVNGSVDVRNCASSPCLNSSFLYFLVGMNNNVLQMPGSRFISICSSYLTDYSLFTSNDFSFNYYNTNSFINYMAAKNEIDSDRPIVLYLDKDYEILCKNNKWKIYYNYPHAVVAYGYRVLANGEVVFLCNMGWNHSNELFSDVFLKIPSDDFSVIAFSLTNNNHICNNDAYIYYHGNSLCDGFGLCHKHASYEYYLDYLNNNANTHKGKCPICHDVLFTELHSYNYDYEWLSNTTHYSYCVCGKRIVSMHSIDGHSNQPNYCFECHGYATGGIISYENIDQEESE